MSLKKTYFFGWANIKWLILQIGLSLSNQESFFSSKRIERMIIFNTAIFSYMIWFSYKYKTLSAAEMVMVIGAFFVMIGYNMSVTEKSKLL